MRYDVDISAAYMEHFAGLVTEIKGATIPVEPGILNYTLREPLGVVARIGAFNHPLLFVAGKCGAPLAAGNTLIIKPADQTPLSALRIAELWHGVFPPGVFNIVTGGRDAGAALASHPQVAKIGFIGSVNAGRAVMQAASATLKALTLELGGKNALIACADASPQEIAEGVVRGMNFRYVTGQSCNSTSRVFLHDAVHDAAIPEIVRQVSRIRIGLPTDRNAEMGCLSSAAQFEKTMNYIRLGQEEGARIAYGGKRPADPRLAKGYFIEPTVFVNVTDHMRIAREEIFGPVVSILRWSDENDLIARVNALDYGLTASIWTHDLDRAHRLASRVQAGYVWINGASTHYVGVPFGGRQANGVERPDIDAAIDLGDSPQRPLPAARFAFKARGMKRSETVLLGEINALSGIGGGAGIGVALAQVQLPAGFLPAVEAGLLDEAQPLVHVHVAELAADQADLVVRALAVAVRRRLLEAHVLFLSLEFVMQVAAV